MAIIRRSRKQKLPPKTNDEVRRLMLEYFYQRNRNAKSPRGETTGAAATISVLRSELKTLHGLTAAEVVSNLTYLRSQGWVAEEVTSSTFATPRGSLVPSVTPYYIITAAGIDRIEGPSDFTRDRFEGIRIEATGQNVITLGDGNQVNVHFQEIGRALSDLREAVRASNALSASEKVELIVDIETIQSQLGKPQPNKGVIKSLWEVVERAAVAAGLAASVAKVAPLIAALLP